MRYFLAKRHEGPALVVADRTRFFGVIQLKDIVKGGIKERFAELRRMGIKTVMIPEENVKDLQDIPENVKNGLEIVPVKWVDKVLEIALEKMPTPLTDEAPAVAASPDGATTPTASVKH